MTNLDTTRTYLPSFYSRPHDPSILLGVIGGTDNWNDPMMYRYYTFRSINDAARKIESKLKKHIKFELVCLSPDNDAMKDFQRLKDSSLKEFFVNTVDTSANIDQVDCLIRIGGDKKTKDSVSKFKLAYPNKYVAEYDEEHMLDGNMYVKLGNFDRPYKIGVTGFSDEAKIDNLSAYRKNIEFSIRSVKDIVIGTHGKIPSFIFVGGLTYSGVNRFMYDYVSNLPDTSKTVGIACAKATNYPRFAVDDEFIIGQEWGDESDFFLEYIDCLIAFPGGKQSKEESQKFQDKYPEKLFLDIQHNLFQ